MKKIVSTLIFLILIVPFTSLAQSDNNEIEGKVYDIVDKKPSLEGFKHNFNKYLKKALVYPEDAFLKQKEGMVYVSFVVTKAGDVKDVFISRSSDDVFNAEAVRVVQKTSGKWKPGMVDKQPVNTRMVLPVRFQLSSEDRDAASLLATFDQAGVKPLFVIDKKIVEGVVKVPDYNVQSIRVIKGKKAVELYGEKGKNGVVVITTKNGVDPIYKMN